MHPFKDLRTFSRGESRGSIPNQDMDTLLQKCCHFPLQIGFRFFFFITTPTWDFIWIKISIVGILSIKLWSFHHVLTIAFYSCWNEKGFQHSLGWTWGSGESIRNQFICPQSETKINVFIYYRPRQSAFFLILFWLLIIKKTTILELILRHLDERHLQGGYITDQTRGIRDK